MTVPTGRTAPLPPRQGQIAELAAQGLSNKQIARQLGLSAESVKARLADTYHVLRIRSRHELRDALAQLIPAAPPSLPPLVPLYPCPHGCGAELAVPSGTPEGERARCGSCGQPTLYAAGALVTCRGAP